MKKQITYHFIILFVCLLFLLSLLSEAIAEPVNIPDPALRAAVEGGLGKNAGDTITQAEIGSDNFTILAANDRGISNLTGLEYATSLQYVYLQKNSISDLSPISNLTGLEHLHLEHNQITDISPLSNITALQSLNISHNNLTSLADLPDLSLVYGLYFHYNQITNIKPLINHIEFTSVNAPYSINLNLEGNLLDDDSVNVHIPTLFIDRNISVRFTTTHSKKVSGNNQTAKTNTKLQPFVVEFVNYKNQKLSGVKVTFHLTTGSGYFVNGSRKQGYEVLKTTTDADGKASATLTTGSTTGIYRISVSGKIVHPRYIGITGSEPFTVKVIETTIDPPTMEQTPQQQEQQQNTSTDESDPIPVPTSEEIPTPLSKCSYPGQIGFSELMISSRGGIHSQPQWIELYNNSNTETVNLRGWQLIIETRDKSGNHRHVVIPLEDMPILPNQTALIVMWTGRNSGDIPEECIYRFFNRHFDEFEQNENRNKVLGQTCFYLKLLDPDGVVSDVAGNLDGDEMTIDKPIWEIPSGTTENGMRTSLIRRYSKDTSLPFDGTKLNNWRRACELQLSVIKYWGSKTDIGNPGYRGANALPVTLSYFRAETKDEGVVINWTTESELENAGFDILRSQTPQGPFVKVNQKIIQGAGTTGKRNTYTWTDTTAKPNIESYYQIEDVSFSGNRQTLNTTRLIGLISAKNRFATRWGELKTRD